MRRRALKLHHRRACGGSRRIPPSGSVCLYPQLREQPRETANQPSHPRLNGFRTETQAAKNTRRMT